MNASEAQVVHGSADNAVLKRMAGELMGEAAGSVAVIALAIAALAGVQPYLLAGIATIVLGAAVLIEGGVLDGREVIERGELASTEFLGGFAGIILGILALLGIASMTLLSVAVIVFGAGLLFSRLVGGDYGGRSLVGIAALVLGILSVVGLSQPVLVPVALLALGTMELIGGLENGARMAAAHAKQA